jgi:enamine deaminase RidA (YjgF/YER057c/UK114 family)
MPYHFNFKYHIINPDPVLNTGGQLEDCLIKTKSFLADNPDFQILFFNWFFDYSKDIDCQYMVDKLKSSGISSLSRSEPTVIAQAPSNSGAFQLVICGLDPDERYSVHYPEVSGQRYVCVHTESQKWVFISVDGCGKGESGISLKSDNSFQRLYTILKNEGLGFKNILRQWNYIPDIVGVSEDAGIIRQNYQEFNEARGKWYRSGGLNRDFPAATGIGTKGSTIRLQAIAAGQGQDLRIVSLHNPGQQNAHQYSVNQLVGTVRRSTPLFERGKLVYGANGGYIWVSGTAAIRGETSVKERLTGQTIITCDNIDELVSEENLRRHGLDSNLAKPVPVYVRAYVKFRDDGPEVQAILEDRYHGAIVHVLEGDVCRDELLVEVEAEFSIG